MDRRLVIRAQEGDHDAFAELAVGELGRLSAIARLILLDRAAAEDAVQDALVDAWKGLPGLRDPDRFPAWIRRLLVRACSDHARRRRQRGIREIAAFRMGGDTLDDTQRSVAVRDQVERALRRLAPDQRIVLVLTYYLDLPLAEAAGIIDIPVGTMKSRLSRALTAMRAALDADARVEAQREGRPA